MNFGLNANVLTPPFSALVSMLMIAGVDWLGLRLAHIFNLLEPTVPAWHRWQVPILGAITLAPSAISQDMRDKIMDRSADGYTVMKWADEVLPIDAVLLSNHRSIALAPRDVVSMDWSNHVRSDTAEAMPYLLRIKKRKVTHVLITGNLADAKLKGCFGNLVAGPSYAHKAMRNPVNRGAQYPAWIYEFNSDELPDCATVN